MTWRGRFFDGKSAARRDVEITILADGLIMRADGDLEIYWPFDRLGWAHPPDASGNALLAHADEPARLDIADPALITALRAACPGIDRAAHRRERHGRTAIIAAGSVAVVAAMVYAAAAFLPALVVPLVPSSVERSIGDAAVDQIITIFATLKKTEPRVCDRAKGHAAIRRLVARLLPGNDPAKGVTVTVADLDLINALSAPGGRLLVFRGLIDFTTNAEEFAGVLAHETGHALHRHSTRGMIRQIGLSSTLGIVTGSAGGQSLAGTAANFLMHTAYSRDAEFEADDAAVDLLGRAGISTAGMETLFDRFAARMPKVLRKLQLISTHPPSKERARHIHERSKPGSGPAMSAADWQAIKTICQVD